MDFNLIEVSQRAGRRPAIALAAAAAFALAAFAVVSPASTWAESPIVRPSAQRSTDLLVTRVSTIHAATPPRRFPLGTGRDGRLRFARGWTTGFWAGTLWQAGDLVPGRYADWALAATRRHIGNEDAQTHDLGFMYGESSVAAYERLCPDLASRSTCRQLKTSGLTAARTLMRVAATGSAAGLIPTRPSSCSDCLYPWQGEAIVDSMMNLPLLYWASDATGRAGFRRVALVHARRAAILLQRADGSTAQAVTFDRSTGLESDTHTHQGFEDSSTWARGQGWSVYGFADAAREFRDPVLLAVAERNAEYVLANLPASGVPMWDYEVPPDSPPDVSAGVITAAGLFHLADACRAMRGACREPARWVSLARHMLSASMAHTSTVEPLGFLGNQVYTMGGRDTWDDDGELVFGLRYALEALALERRYTPGR